MLMSTYIYRMGQVGVGCECKGSELVYHSELVSSHSLNLWTLKKERKGAVEGAGVLCEGVV